METTKKATRLENAARCARFAPLEPILARPNEPAQTVDRCAESYTTMTRSGLCVYGYADG